MRNCSTIVKNTNFGTYFSTKTYIISTLLLPPHFPGRQEQQVKETKGKVTPRDKSGYEQGCGLWVQNLKPLGSHYPEHHALLSPPENMSCVATGNVATRAHTRQTHSFLHNWKSQRSESDLICSPQGFSHRDFMNNQVWVFKPKTRAS